MPRVIFRLLVIGVLLLGACGGDDAVPRDGGGSRADGGGPVRDGGPGSDGGPRADVGPGPGLDGGGGGGGMRIGTNFWNLGWGIWDDVFAPGVDFSTTTDPWNPAFVAELRPYAVLRFMDFGQANETTEERWSERTQPGDSPPAQEKLAYEWMIDLCNRTGTDMWVTVPTRADDDYAVQLATLIHARLDPERRVYVEWSNETWNGIFPQREHAVAEGLALGLDGDANTAGAEFHVYRAVRIFARFEAVFGVGSPRVVKVIAGQSVNTWLTQTHLAALEDSTINPEGMAVDAYAIAPYFGGGLDGRSGDAADRLHAAVAEAVDAVAAQHELVSAAGLPLIAYEGGQHVYDGADVVNASPEMYAIYRDYLDGIAPYLAVFVHYLHNGEWSSGGAWGAERYVGQPLSEAHKLRALYDWISAHP